MSTSSDDENEDCPICVEPLDGDDRQFQACDCLFRVCMFCVRRLMTEFEGKCPACRKPYNEANFKMRELSPEQVERRRLKLEKQRLQERNARKQQQQQQQPMQGMTMLANNNSLAFRNTRGTTNGGNALLANGGGLSSFGVKRTHEQQFEHENALAQQRRGLANVKVLQPNAVFVVGLVQQIAREEILRRNEYFGQYGQIIKIVIGHPVPVPGRAVTLSAHITYVRVDDALHAIQSLNGTMMEGHPIRLSSGTTRYCHSFLRGQHCNTTDCTYLHHEVDATRPTQQQQQQQHAATPTFGGTDPFDLTSSPSPQPTPPPAPAPMTTSTRLLAATAPHPCESLHGIELSQYQKQRNRAPAALTLTKSIGEGVHQDQVAGTSPPPTITAPATATTFDATFGHLADLILARTQVGDDMRKHFSAVFQPRASASAFTGLDSVFQLNGPFAKPPMFVAPLLSSSSPAQQDKNRKQ